MEPKFKHGDTVRLNFSPQSKYIVIGCSFKVQNGNNSVNTNRYWLQSTAIQTNPPTVHEHSEEELELDN